jgi:hypothetical protein
MADQLQIARRHTDNSRECSCPFATFNNQRSTIKLGNKPRIAQMKTDLFA